MSTRTVGGRPRRDLDLRWAVVTLALLFAVREAEPVVAQDEVRNFEKPILLVETEGHHAPVRSLIWRNSSSLLSGGQDKVVRVWDFRDGPRLVRTIRPPIWRGPAGIIYAMALSPRPDEQGQSLLAVGGFGVESRRGDITIFRIPGLTRTPTGEIVKRLLPPRSNDPQAIGHRNTVLCLAFDPSGRTLASGSMDRTVILWDVPTLQPRAVLRGHTGEIRALAFSPDGRRLATTGTDGSLRLWDVNTGAQVDERAGHPQAPVSINTLAFSPDGLLIVIGREDGDLFRFDARSISQIAPVKLPTLAGQGSVESLAYHPDGRRLVVSIKSDRADTLDPMKIACDLEVRAMPGGEVTHRRRVPGLVYACGFSPDGNLLAYSGGTAQGIFIQDMRDLKKAPDELKGQGTTIFDLGFTADSQVIGFTRERFDPANPPQSYEGFDMARRQYRIVPGGQLRRAIKEYNGWTLSGSINQYRLEAVNADGRRWRFDLDPNTERNWWSYTFVPPGPGHPRPTVAVGCEAGVVITDLETGRRTRLFAGHSSPVVSVVPSPDGRWLASSSIDQTIMFYPLAGCDTRPGLGATFQQRADGSWVVAKVEPKSFAAAMGLRVGDVITKAGIGSLRTATRDIYQRPEEIGRFVARVDELPPYHYEIGIFVRRALPFPFLGVSELDLPPMPSTKRNNPSLTLLPDIDREWVLWTPQGYYDTSIEGDTRLLGWQINPPYDQSKPTDFVPIGTYAGTMNQPAVLDGLWRTGDLDQALAALPAGIDPPERYARDEQPPQIAFTSIQEGVRLPAPGVVWAVGVPEPRILLSIAMQGKSKVRDRQVVFDERLLPRPRIAEPVAEFQEDLQVELPPNRRVRLLVKASNVTGTTRSEYIDMVYTPPRPPEGTPPVAEAKPRLVVLSIGNEHSPNPKLLPPVRFADKDAQSLALFLPKHLLAATSDKPVQERSDNLVVLTGSLASTRSITRAFDRLRELLETKQLHQGDLVTVVMASHVLEFDQATLIATADIDENRPPRTAISAREVSERLGELTDYGCRVVLFLDGVHELPEGQYKSSIKPWVRDLWLNRRVTTFVASKEGPSGIDVPAEHGLFALGLLRAFQAAQNPHAAAYSLEQFKTAVVQEVLNLSSRQQEVGCYIPRAVSPRIRFATP